MSKNKRPPHTYDNPIADLQEWQAHQYDPGYRSNLTRLRLFAGDGRAQSGGVYIARALVAMFVLTIVFSLVPSLGVPKLIVAAAFLLATIAVIAVTVARLQQAREHQSRHRGNRRRQ